MKTSDGQISMAPQGASGAYQDLKSIHLDTLNRTGDHWNWPAVTTLTRPTLARILHLNFLYEKILPLSGVICEFGVHFGGGMTTLSNLRAIYEPYNYARHIFGFDTFTGFVGSEAKDGDQLADGAFEVPSGYDLVLDKTLSAQESLCPNAHIKKYTLYKGDASESVLRWLSEHPYAIVAIAIFDMDIYKPTKEVLQAILPRMPKGSLLVFDELNCPHFPGETLALMEVLKLQDCSLERSPFVPYSTIVYR